MANDDLIPPVPGSYAVWLDGHAIAWGMECKQPHDEWWKHENIVRAYASILGWRRSTERAWNSVEGGYEPLLACRLTPVFDVEESSDVLLIVLPDGRCHELMPNEPMGGDPEVCRNRMFQSLDDAIDTYRRRWYRLACEREKDAQRLRVGETKPAATVTRLHNGGDDDTPAPPAA